MKVRAQASSAIPTQGASIATLAAIAVAEASAASLMVSASWEETTPARRNRNPDSRSAGKASARLALSPSRSRRVLLYSRWVSRRSGMGPAASGSPWLTIPPPPVAPIPPVPPPRAPAPPEPEVPRMGSGPGPVESSPAPSPMVP